MSLGPLRRGHTPLATHTLSTGSDTDGLVSSRCVQQTFKSVQINLNVRPEVPRGTTQVHIGVYSHSLPFVPIGRSVVTARISSQTSLNLGFSGHTISSLLSLATCLKLERLTYHGECAWRNIKLAHELQEIYEPMERLS